MKISLSISPLLAVAFIILKLTSVIHWSWMWVLAPFWMPTTLAFVFIFILMLIKSRRERKAKKQVEKIVKKGW